MVLSHHQCQLHLIQVLFPQHLQLILRPNFQGLLDFLKVFFVLCAKISIACVGFSRCRRLIPSGGRAASFLRENIIRKKMAQFTEMNPTAALPSFFQQFIPRSSSTFKLNQELTRPDDAEFADDEW